MLTATPSKTRAIQDDMRTICDVLTGKLSDEEALEPLARLAGMEEEVSEFVKVSTFHLSQICAFLLAHSFGDTQG